ncbi:MULTISPECIES: hypothetical protein [unclassified Endozoicomonas]|uniref:hypothetical protein n=1 Tax=unclassified Endozoicomonas TaxID=2644528 RepID=UPI003BB575B6
MKQREQQYMRRIIQIFDTPHSSFGQGYLSALCDDGTIWFHADNKWHPLRELIPQEGMGVENKINILVEAMQTEIRKSGGNLRLEEALTKAGFNA